MPTLRDQLLGLANTLRGLPPAFGLRRFAVTVKRRTWGGQQQGEGTATDYSIGITPAPRVEDLSDQIGKMTPTEMELAGIGNGTVIGKLYKIDQITPYYSQATTVNGITTQVSGGFKAEMLRLWPYRDQGYVENLVTLVGDDGLLRECVQITVNQSNPFNYSMLVKEIDRPRSNLQTAAVTPATAAVRIGVTTALVCIGTFNGGGTSVLTTITTWTSSAPGVAAVDIYGNVTGLSAGVSTITGVVLGVTATATVTVS